MLMRVVEFRSRAVGWGTVVVVGRVVVGGYIVEGGGGAVGW